MFCDSKAIDEAKRDHLFEVLMASNSYIAVGAHSLRWIDRVNILNATLSAMTRAVLQLKVVPDEVLIDGNRIPKSLSIPAKAIVKGDATVPVISAASIIAKVTRDRIMRKLDGQFPQYLFSVHKGYGTAAHYAVLGKWGPSLVHRRSFNLTVQERLF
jgi:ribonuclease HII